jgi:hypothetical protein
MFTNVYRNIYPLASGYFSLQVWREIDVRITRYHVEACDNAKFLGAIEKSSHAIYLEVTPRPSHLPSLKLENFKALVMR